MYHTLAEFYDRFQDIDYESFVDYYQEIFKRFSLNPELVLDLGCGTGSVTLAMAKRGYEMIGLDCSEEMLGIARERAESHKQDILFLYQDMTEFELYGTVDAMVCALDGINYLTGDEQLKKMLSLLHYYLNPGGILIFDINTEYKFSHTLDGQTFIYDEDDVFCSWSNEFDREDKICYFDLTFFIKNSDGTYVRQDEYQEERAYSVAEIKNTIEECGLTCLGVFDNLSFNQPEENSERIFFIIQRKEEKK